MDLYCCVQKESNRYIRYDIRYIINHNLHHYTPIYLFQSMSTPQFPFLGTGQELAESLIPRHRAKSTRHDAWRVATPFSHWKKWWVYPKNAGCLGKPLRWSYELQGCWRILRKGTWWGTLQTPSSWWVDKISAPTIFLAAWAELGVGH